MPEKISQKKIEEMKERLTKGELKKGTKFFDSQERGLIVFIGAKMISFRYRLIENKKETMLTLGNDENTTLSEAREIVRTIKRKREEKRKRKTLGKLLGIEVEKEGEKKSIAEEKEVKVLLPKIKVREIVEKFLEKKVKEGVSASTLRQQKLYVKLICSELGEVEAEKLLTKDAVDFLEKQLQSRKAKVASFLRAAFDYAATSGTIESSPLKTGFEKTLTKSKEVGHIIAPKTLGEYFSEIGTCFASTKRKDKKILFLLLQLLPVRFGELQGLSWGDLDLNAGVVSFVQPKVGKAQNLPLNSLAISLFRAIDPIKFDSMLKTEFQKKKSEEKIFNLPGTTFRRMYENCQNFSPHSSRSCFSTFLLDLAPEHGISRDDTENCLGHKIDPYRGAYQRSKELERKRKTLDTWTRLLCSNSEVRQMFRSCSGFPVSDPRYPIEFLNDGNNSGLELQRQLKNLTDSI